MKLNFMKQWKWWRIDLTGLGVLAGLLLAGNWLVVEPIVARRVNRIVQRGEMAFLESEVMQTEISTESLQFELERLQMAMERQPLRLQSAQHSNLRLAKITSLASSHNLVLDQVRIGEATGDAEVASVPINLTGQGPFTSFVKFLAQAHLMFPDTEVFSLSLSDNPGDSKSPTRFDIDLLWYAAPVLTAAEK